MAVISAVNEVREEIANRLNEAEGDNTNTYTNWINLALNDLENSFPDAPYLQTSADRTLSSGTRVYPAILPTDFSKMNALLNPAGNAKISYLPPEQFDIVKPSASDTGNPTIYTIRGSQFNAILEVFPLPGSAITVHLDYQRVITSVSSNTISALSGVPFPQKYYEALILFGEYMGWRRRGRFEESNVIRAQYDKMKDDMRNELRSRVTEMQRMKGVREFQRVDRAYDDPIKNIFWGDRTFL